MSDYNFTVVLNTEHFEVGIDNETDYGYFEHNDLGDECGGGLWFTKTDDGKLDLEDYDGVFQLPVEVCDVLREYGYNVDDIFYP